jgi:hypothetical protein
MDNTMHNRRNFLRASGAALLGAAAVSRVAQGAVPEAPIQTTPDMQPPLVPPNGRPYNPVATLNGWTLPWRMNNGWKEFHLVAEPVRRQIAPGTVLGLGIFQTRPKMRGYVGDVPQNMAPRRNKRAAVGLSVRF